MQNKAQTNLINTYRLLDFNYVPLYDMNVIWISKCKAMYYECVLLLCDDFICYMMLWQVFDKYEIWYKWIIPCVVY